MNVDKSVDRWMEVLAVAKKHGFDISDGEKCSELFRAVDAFVHVFLEDALAKEPA